MKNPKPTPPALKPRRSWKSAVVLAASAALFASAGVVACSTPAEAQSVSSVSQAADWEIVLGYYSCTKPGASAGGWFTYSQLMYYINRGYSCTKVR